MPFFPRTLTSPADAQEVWDMFWVLVGTLNRDIYFHPVSGGGDVNFGTFHDESSTSLNLLHTQILYDSAEGHSHSVLGDGAVLSSQGLRGRHFDKDSLRVLWAHYFDDQIEDSQRKRLVICTGEFDATTVGGRVQIPATDTVPGYAEIPGRFATALTLDLDFFSWYDPNPLRWRRWTAEVLATFVTFVDGDRSPLDPIDLTDDTRAYVSEIAGVKQLCIEGAANTTYRVRYITVVQFTG